jgi:predicted Zn-dependent protease
MRLRAASPALLCATLALAACATNPVTGQQEISLMSAEREIALGRQGAAEVEREIGLVRDPKLEAYVGAIGQRLARASPRRDVAYRFAVADMPEPNAFALPGGYVYVSRGLVALANSEDELANVIGHEIGHVAARHAAQRETRSLGVGILSALGAIAAGLAGGAEAAQMASQLGQVAGAGLIASYGRDQERQADVVGQGLAAESGWDPAAMTGFLVALERESALRPGPTRRPSFLDSHPSTSERIAATRARAAELPRGPTDSVARGRGDYLRRIEGLLVGPDPNEGVFEGQRFLHPGLGIALELPRGWQTQNQKTAVAALAPGRDAMEVLEMQGRSGDPRAAARAWAQANPVQVVDSESTRIGGFPAFRALAQARSQSGATALDVTWIAHPKGMFRITAMSSPARYPAYANTFERTAESFRQLRADEREGIHALRLRIASGRAGESLAALSRRSGNRWSVAETAVANGLPPDARLASGQLVKLAVAAPIPAR